MSKIIFVALLVALATANLHLNVKFRDYLEGPQ